MMVEASLHKARQDSATTSVVWPVARIHLPAEYATTPCRPIVTRAVSSSRNGFRASPLLPKYENECTVMAASKTARLGAQSTPVLKTW